MLFKALKLDSRLLQAIDASGFKTPTEIQCAAIPAVLSGIDLMASARTGTGNNTGTTRKRAAGIGFDANARTGNAGE